MDAVNAIRGSSAFLALLRDEGVTHLFGNPGTTELPVMDALGRQTELPYVLGLQESVVIGMADGFGRATGQLTACNVHVAPGLGNAMGAIYNARYTGTPMIITAGQHEQGHGLTEPVLYAPLVPIAAPLVKWAVEITRLEDMPRIVRRAAKVAMTPPTGPVFLSLPGDVLNDEAGLDLTASTRVDTRTRPSDAAIEALAARLIDARNPAIIAGDEIVKGDALAEVGRLAELLGAAAWQQTIAFGAHFPSEHPCFMGALSRAQRQIRQALEPHDLLLFIGADVLRTSIASDISPLPPGAAIIQIGLLDIVFSLDSVITAVGMAEDVWVMVSAIVVAMGFMMIAAESVGRFVGNHPTVKMLALSFLLLIGMSLVADGFGQHIPKGYIYFAMGFSVFVEVLNLRQAKKGVTPVHLRGPEFPDEPEEDVAASP